MARPRTTLVSGGASDSPQIRAGTLLEGKVQMAAMKPRTGDGPMEVTKEGRSLIMRVPLEGGGRLVVELNAEEAAQLKECLVGVTE